MRPLEGKVALVTGAGTGIGKATALAMARAGARLVLAGRGEENGQATCREILEAGGEALWVRTDVTVEAEVEALVARALEHFGRLDAAFNNAGSGGASARLAELDAAEWDKTLHGFLTSVFYCMKHEIPALLASGGGAIVNNSSVDGLRAFPWDPAYSAAKHGVLGLTKSAALQYAKQGLRINAVCPGWIRTPPVEEMLARDPGVEERLLTHQPIGRLGDPEEVAQAVLWLCSGNSSLVLGAELAVDGGYLAI